jgi:hypothetical protein
MSTTSGDAHVLTALAREGGRFTWNHLAYRGIKAASRLIRRERAHTCKDAAGGWDLGPAETTPGAQA